MRIKSFDKYNESIKDDLKLSENYKEVKEELINLIEKSIDSPNKKKLKDFINLSLKNTNEVSIQGLINVSDIWEFYLKHRNEIDEILYDSKFYDINPSSLESFGLYDYVIKGTKESITEILKLIKKDL